MSKPRHKTASPGSTQGPAALIRRVGAVLALVGLTACAPLGSAPTVADPAAAPAAAQVQLRLIAFNDFHGNLEVSPGLTLPWPDPAQPDKALRLNAGGAAPLAGLVKALRDGAPHSLVISSGDLVGATPLVSALFFHETTVQVMNQLGLDLAIPGNHEFDAGKDELLRLMQGGCRGPHTTMPFVSCAPGPYTGARFAMFAANVFGADGRTLFPASVVREVAGVKVGFIGAVTKITPSIVVPSGVAGLRFGDEADTINAEAARLTAQGVNTLIAVIHEGGDTGTPGLPKEWNDVGCPQARGAIFDIARRLSPRIDLIFSAHTHQGYRCLVGGRPVMQATALGRGVSVADLVIDARTGLVDRAQTRHRNLPVFNELSNPALREAIIAAEPAPFASALRAALPDAVVTASVAQAVAAAAPRAHQTVGRIGGVFDRSAATDASAGRLVAQAQWLATRAPDQGGAQFALMNPGGVRSDLRCASGAPPCDIRFGDAFTMQPFGNSLVVMSLSGAQIKQLLEDQQRPGRQGPLFLIPSATLRYEWHARAPYGQRVQQLRLQGQALAPDQDYRLTVNSFLAEGGDGFLMLIQGRQRVGGGQDLDALTAHLQTSPSPDPVPRIVLVGAGPD